MAPKTFSFPHGASGIELGDFVIQSGKDKVVLLTKGQGEHYTLQAGHTFGVLDIHHTGRTSAATSATRPFLLCAVRTSQIS